jgi:hypothetical protein
MMYALELGVRNFLECTLFKKQRGYAIQITITVEKQREYFKGRHKYLTIFIRIYSTAAGSNSRTG